MFNLFDKFVHQAEQSRHSYNVQTEEFRLLNSNFNDYLDEMKTIDENNRQLQQMIDEIRTNYLVRLENHLIRVPEELRQQSRILTAAHHERYKYKSRARRFIAEREELKRRIHFVAVDEKEQLKRLNQLEKQHRIICKENRRMVEQIDQFVNHVEHEKVLHRQAMQRVDQLQQDFERICVERSKSEFEIQSLKEEVQRMQTAREFLDDERELFISNQTEAEEYFLSHLNESIQRIREDFEQLNRSQMKQLENEYEEKLRWIDEYSRRTSTSSSTSSDMVTDDSQRVEREKLENDFRIVTQELNIVNDQYQTLTQRVQQMEIDLYILREDRQRQLASKDHEFERNQLQLQTLNEQLTLLAEYDRNLKFELTLYRGVLENEYRRKQQRTANNKKKTGISRTDKTATAFPIDLQTVADDSSNRVRVESDYDQLGDSTNGHVQSIVEPSSPIIEIQPPSSTDTSTTSLRSIDQCVESSSSSSIQTVVEQPDDLQFHRQTTSILSSKDIEEILSKNSADEPSVPRIPSPISDGEPDLVVDLTAKPTEAEAEEEEAPRATPSSSSPSSVPVEHCVIGGLSSIVVRPEESSQDSSFTDVEEITSSLPLEQTQPKLVEDEQDPNLIGIMQDLRFVFHDLANADGLVEINAELPDKLLDRLEFRDHLIRTLFDSLLRKYLVQSAAQSQRSTTLDWTEFRDILFPIITGRRTERQIRTLFNLFDTRKDGYLSLQEIAELLEILQANDTIDLAQNIIDEFDKDHDGKLSADELIEAIKKTDDTNENVLSEEFETKPWFTQAPTDEMSVTSLEVVIGSTNEDKIIVLAQIFRNLSGNSQTNLLDSFRENLTLDLTSEIIKLNIPIPNADLERLIESFIEQRQQKNPFISWIDFRDFFLPIINGGYLTKSDLQQYFDLLDSFDRGTLTNDEILQLLRLLQIADTNVVRNKLAEKIETQTDPNAGWTFAEFLFALENVDETAVRILSPPDEQQRRNDFDLEWLTKEIKL